MNETEQQVAEIESLIAKARVTDAAHIKDAVAEANRAAARLRDSLRRAGRTGTGDPAALRRVNQVLSLLAGVENPSGPIPWHFLDQAAEVLRTN